MRRSTRWSAMARTISRPSFAVVTLQALVRRYFAISARVSRSSSTTRTCGDAVDMRILMPVIRTNDRGFLFRNVSDVALATQGTCRHGDKKASLRSRPCRRGFSQEPSEARHPDYPRCCRRFTDATDASGLAASIALKEEFSG